MNLSEAWNSLMDGKVISREAWGDTDKVVHLASEKVAVGPQLFTQEDLDANDWFVVAHLN